MRNFPRISVFTCSGRRRITAAAEKQLYTDETEPAAQLILATQSYNFGALRCVQHPLLALHSLHRTMSIFLHTDAR